MSSFGGYVLAVILFYFSARFVLSTGTNSAFVCTQEWTVHRNQPKQVFDNFQNWILDWQSDCNKKRSEGLMNGNGIGSSLHSTVRWMIWAIEEDKVYRPSHHWLWADLNNSKCTDYRLNRTIDCYFRPLTLCGLKQANGHTQQSSLNDRTKVAVLPASSVAMLPVLAMDSCTMAARNKKTLQWIHGSFLHYLMQYNVDTARDVQRRVDAMFPQTLMNVTTTDTSYIGVHIRGGKPDANRHPANVSYYIAMVDEIALQFQRLKRPVSRVYFCSDLPDETFVSADYLSRAFPRPWQYMALPHISLPTDTYKEAQHYLESNLLTENYSRRDLAVEYFADIEILAKVDAFIGSTSTVYPTVVGLRIARGNNWFKNHSCFMQIRHTPPSFHCEGSVEAHTLWTHFSLGGYTGGSMF